jgi:hypothetical protein
MHLKFALKSKLEHSRDQLKPSHPVMPSIASEHINYGLPSPTRLNVAKNIKEHDEVLYMK